MFDHRYIHVKGSPLFLSHQLPSILKALLRQQLKMTLSLYSLQVEDTLKGFLHPTQAQDAKRFVSHSRQQLKVTALLRLH